MFAPDVLYGMVHWLMSKVALCIPLGKSKLIAVHYDCTLNEGKTIYISWQTLQTVRKQKQTGSSVIHTGKTTCAIRLDVQNYVCSNDFFT